MRALAIWIRFRLFSTCLKRREKVG